MNKLRVKFKDNYQFIYHFFHNITMSLFDLFDTAGKVYVKIHDSIEKWNTEAPVSDHISKVAERVVEILSSVHGMSPTHSRDFIRATPIFTLRDGTVLKIYKNPLNLDHIFVSDDKGKMIFCGFVYWGDSENLHQSIAKIKKELS
jgi:hypothetical protein